MFIIDLQKALCSNVYNVFLFTKTPRFTCYITSCKHKVTKAVHLIYVLQSQLRCWHHRCGVTANGKDLNLTRNSNIKVFEAEG
jgi:hypothetical protein